MRELLGPTGRLAREEPCALSNLAHTEPGRAPYIKPIVLVVEDEVLPRLSLSAELRAVGYRVYEARSAEDALRVLGSIPRIDGVISDINLPGSLDGFELIRWLNMARPQTKVILTSAYTDSIANAKNLCRFDAIVQKPYSDALLVAMLGSLLHQN